MCDSPSLFILSVLCVVVSISGRLYFCIFSCDPLLFLSGVLCPSPQAIGAFYFSMLSGEMVRMLQVYCVLTVTGWNTVYCVVCSLGAVM